MIYEQYNINIIKSSRKTISVEIKDDLSLLVRVPRRMKIDDILRFISDKNAWINKHIEIIRKRNESAPPPVSYDINALKNAALRLVTERVRFFAPLIGVSYGRITVRAQKTRWGSCSAKGNLNFNCLLALCTPEIVDYVVVHELCHRKQLNHSPAFWKEVENILPDWRKRRKQLRENGTALIKNLK